MPTTPGARIFGVAKAAMTSQRGGNLPLTSVFNSGGMSSGLGVSKQPNLLRRLAVKALEQKRSEEE